MSFNRIIAVFGVVLFLFAIVVFYLFSLHPRSQTLTTTLLSGKVTIDNHQFTAEIATTSAQQEQGLSGRASLPQDHGMLFVFDQPGFPSFWMRNMQFPIDIIFIQNDRIVSIVDNAPPPNKQTAHLPIYQPTSPINYVLEIPAGLSKKYGFKPGDTVTIVK